MKKKYDIKGMGCAACSARIEKAVGDMKGVQRVEVNLLANTMIVNYDENITSSDEISEVVKNSGYEAIEDDEDSHQNGGNQLAAEQMREMKRRFLISLVFMVPLFIISMGHMAGLHIPATINAGIQLVLVAPIVGINYKYYATGFAMLFRKSPNMDSLIAIGSVAALSLLYFESAGMILTLVTLGKWLEAGAKGRTGAAIEKLVNMAPKEAHIIRDGKEITVAVEDIAVGDIVAVKPGESIPVDGIILSGETTIDESALTGESIPVDKTAGEHISSATVNRTGYFTFEAVKVGENTTLAQIVKLVEEAASSKAPISKLADRVAGIFVPIVIGIAALAIVIWLVLGMDIRQALTVGISVLVISCPCALGLATPVAIMAGTGRGAEKGILVKSAEALELAHKIDTVVLDKTGTVTEGRPEVSDVIAVKEEFDLRLAASLEKHSEHPLGQAVVKEAVKRNLDIDESDTFTAVSGRGIRSEIHGHIYVAGNAEFLYENGINAWAEIDCYPDLANQGKTIIYFGKMKDNENQDSVETDSRAGELIGAIALRDVPKPTSREAVKKIEGMGIKVTMLTGDNKLTAEAIKNEIGIDDVIAQVMPEDKENVIAGMQKNGETVAMVGDGINDAPAIMRADVGIAIGAAMDIAIDSADVVLVKNDLRDVASMISLSRATIKNIKENLFWAFFYNVLGIPLAAGALYPFTGWLLDPMFAAAAMSLSSVCVVINALRLRKAKI